LPDCLDALRLVAELLDTDGGEEGVGEKGGTRWDPEPFREAIDRVANASPLAQLLGAVLGICVSSSLRDADELAEALTGRFGVVRTRKPIARSTTSMPASTASAASDSGTDPRDSIRRGCARCSRRTCSRRSRSTRSSATD